MTEIFGEWLDKVNLNLENGYIESGFIIVDWIPSYKFEGITEDKEDLSIIASELVFRNWLGNGTRVALDLVNNPLNIVKWDILSISKKWNKFILYINNKPQIIEGIQ